MTRKLTNAVADIGFGKQRHIDLGELRPKREGLVCDLVLVMAGTERGWDIVNPMVAHRINIERAGVN